MRPKKLHILSLFFILGILVFFETGCRSSEKASGNLNSATENSDSSPESFSEAPETRSDDEIRDSLSSFLKDELKDYYHAQANRLTSFYILAQQRFYSAEYDQALLLINRAANIKETADVLALKGSIYYGLGSIENFVSNWKQALDLDKNVPIPPSPPIVEELKRQGLLNDNLERNY